jgi:hypothetical protein
MSRQNKFCFEKCWELLAFVRASFEVRILKLGSLFAKDVKNVAVTKRHRLVQALLTPRSSGSTSEFDSLWIVRSNPPKVNPATTSFNASDIKTYNTTNWPLGSKNENIFFSLSSINALAYYKSAGFYREKNKCLNVSAL